MRRSGQAIRALVGMILVGMVGILLFRTVFRPRPIPIFPDPSGIADSTWLEPRRDAQIEASQNHDVVNDFRFTNELERSGITFRHRVVRDAAKTYKPVHYDHGNGVPYADVDGDGHLDIYFVNQVGGNELWRNKGDGTFENITAAAGVAVAGPVGVTASFADIDNDGDPDLYVTVIREGNRLFENDGTGRFTDISVASGLDYRGHPSSPVFFDYDRDGLLDLFLPTVGLFTEDTTVTVTPEESGVFGDRPYEFYNGFSDAFEGHLYEERFESSRLYHNEGGNRFTDVTEQMGLGDLSFSGDATPLDVNEDGWIDLYILDMQGNDEYYENVNGEVFRRRTDEVFPVTPWGAMSMKVFDFNNDGRMDLFVTDMHSDMSQQIGPDDEKLKADIQYSLQNLNNGGFENSIYGNALFLAEGGEGFREVSDEVGAENYWPWGFSVGDLNADGYDDVFIASSMNYPWRYGINSVLLNDRGVRFIDSEFVLGVEPRTGGGMMQPWFTMDCDAPTPSLEQLQQYCANSTGLVQVWGAMGSRSSAIFDIDDDGDLDIVTGEFHGVPMVLVSNLSETRDIRFLKVRLVGTESNRDGLGAIVRVTAGGISYSKVNDGVSGYLSHSVYPLYFGLGEADTVERIEVVWPSGRTQLLEGPIELNRLLEIIEG